MSSVCKVCLQSFVAEIRSKAGLKGIKKGPVNVDNCPDRVASIHLAIAENILKLKVYLIGIRRNALVAFRLQSIMLLL